MRRLERFSKEDSAPAKYGTDGVFQRSSKGFMGQCYDPSTEILTEDGWISIKTIVHNRYSRKVYSLNPETDEIEFVIAIDWQRYFFEGELLNFTGRSIDLLVTPNHKLWLSYGNGKKKFAEARSVNSNFSMYNQGEWKHGENRDFLSIVDKKYQAKAFMRFLGIYLGDGCIVHRKKQPKKKDFISISAKISRKKDLR